MDTPTTSEVLDVLKGILRGQGLTYRELGARLGMSESGLKKLFTSDNASLTRLLDICRVLDVELEEVIRVARRGPLPMVEPDEQQQAIFARHPASLWFLWALEEAGGDAGEARRALGLDARAARRHLGRLEGLGLVVLSSDGIYRLPHRGHGWRLGRALGEPVMDPLHDAVLASARRNKRCYEPGDPEAQPVDLGMARLRLRKETALELRQALRTLMGEFSLRARREATLFPSESRLPMAVMTVLAPFELREVF
jgi:DNA-binding Xre family transcriptional regulator